MNLYSDLIISLYKNPLNKRAISGANFTHSGANLTCGDRVRVYARFDNAGKFSEVTFEGEGCAISIAAASILTEEAKKKTPEEIANWNLLTVNEWLGIELTPARAKCGLLALETLQEGVKKNTPQQTIEAVLHAKKEPSIQGNLDNLAKQL